MSDLDYDAAVDSVLRTPASSKAPAGAPDLGYDSAVDTVLAGQTQRAQQNIVAATRMAPEQAAKVHTMARDAGLPAYAVEGNEAQVFADLTARKNQDLLLKDPVLARAIANNPAFADIAFDELDKAKQISDAWQKSGFAGASRVARRIDDKRAAVFRGLPSGTATAEPRKGLLPELGEAMLRGWEKAGVSKTIIASELGLYKGAESELAAQLRQELRAYGSRPMPEDVSAGLAEIKKAGEESFTAALRAIAANPRAVVEVTAESLTASAPGLAGAAFGSMAGPFGSGAGAAMGSLAVEYASVLTETLGDTTDVREIREALADKTKMEAARKKGLARGIPIAIFDGITAGLAGRLLAGAKATVPSVAGRAAGEVGIQAVGGGAGEAVAGAVTGEFNWGDVLLEAFAEIPSAITEVPGNYRYYQQLRDADKLNGLMDEIAKSAAKQRDPVTFKSFMDGVTDNATVFVNADDLQQVLAQNGMSVDVLPTAAGMLAQGPSVTGDVEIPVGELMTAFAGTPAQEQIVQHTRVRQDDLSQAQWEQMGDIGAFLKSQTKEVQERQKQNEQFQSELDEIEASFTGQLPGVPNIATAGYGSRDQQLVGRMVRHFYAVAADRMGVSPKQVADLWSVKFPGADQATPVQAVTLGSPVKVSWTSGKYTFTETRTYEHRPDDGRISRTTTDESGTTKKEWLIVRPDGSEVWAAAAGQKDDYANVTPEDAQRIANDDMPDGAQAATGPALTQGFDHGKPMVNIGLDIGDQQNALSKEDAIAMLQKLGVTVTDSNVLNLTHEWGNENTLVAHLDKPLTPEQMTQLMADTQQEAIPQYEGGVGTLYHATPEAATKWGPFNPEYFRDLQGTSLLDAQKVLAQKKTKTPKITEIVKGQKLEQSTPLTAKQWADVRGIALETLSEDEKTAWLEAEQEVLAGVEEANRNSDVLKEIAKTALEKMPVPRVSTVPLLAGRLKLKIEPTGNFRKDGTRKTRVPDVARALFNKFRNAKASVETPEGREIMARAMTHEALYALSQDGHAVGWYDRKVREAIMTFALVHPEVLTSPRHNLAFRLIAAITSNGQAVRDNFILANDIYNLWSKDQVFPTEFAFDESQADQEVDEEETPPAEGFEGGGQRKPAMVAAFKKINVLVKELGWDAIESEMLQLRTVRDVEKEFGLKIGGENKDTVIPTAVGLGGPKIGNFFANLSGYFDSPTMDLWFMRTAGRMEGTLLETKAALVEHLDELLTLLPEGGDVKGQPVATLRKEIEKYKALDKEAQLDAETTLKTLKHVSIYARAQFSQFASPHPDTGKTYWDKSDVNVNARRLVNNLAAVREAPSSGGERNNLRAVVTRAMELLEKQGISLTAADLQAVLWYHEKNLYSKLGDISASAKPWDYASAARFSVGRELGLVDVGSRQRAEAVPAGQPAAGGAGGLGAVQGLGQEDQGGALAQAVRSSGAVAGPVVGIHYSQQPRTSLASSAFGSGMPGAERERLATATDPRIKQRVAFYVNTGKGITPESGVGPHPHVATLRNLYDADADALKIWRNSKGDMNAAESAVLDAGFDGYLTRNFGGTGAAVMLGSRNVDVQSVKREDVDTVAELPPSPEIPRMKQAAMAILQNTKLPFGQQSVESWKRDLERTDPDTASLIDWAAIPPGDYYKDQIAARLWQNDTWYYSALSRAMENAPAKVFGSGKAVAQWLQANAGKLAVKKEEIEATGITDWLETQPKVTKEQVVEFLKQGGVQIEEVQLGGKPPITTVAQAKAYLQQRFNEDPNERYGFDNPADYVQIANDWLAGETEPNETTKFEQYQLPGGENYREVLITLPPVEVDEMVYIGKGPFEVRQSRGKFYIVDRLGEWGATAYDSSEAAEQAFPPYSTKLTKRAISEMFESSHFPGTPNILAHVRFNERTDADGKRVLFIEEIQSDWAQKGRRVGFVTADDVAAQKQAKEQRAGLKRDFDEFNAQHDAAKGVLANEANRVLRGMGLSSYSDIITAGADRARLTEEYAVKKANDVAYMRAKERVDELETLTSHLAESMSDLEQSVSTGDKAPSAPFVTDTKSWTALALKRMIAYAAENGFDSIAWTTGEQQAARYDLSKQVERVTIQKMSRDSYALQAIGLSGETIVDRTISKPEDAEEYIGKEPTAKLIKDMGAGIRGQVSGLDLKVGGEGMKGYYDGIVPQVANDVLKKIGGGKVTQLQVQMARVAKIGSNWGLFNEETGDIDQRTRDPRVAMRRAAQPQPGFDITPAMREAVGAGLPLFARDEQQRRGSFNPLSFELRLTEHANRTTLIHELSHFFMAAYIEMAQQPNAPAELTEFVENLLGYLFKTVPGGEQVGGEGLGQKVGAGGTAHKAVDINSPEFKAWFGDSKVVDADGKPLRVYHGTDADFTEFKLKFAGTKHDSGFLGTGFYFADTPSHAERYGRDTVMPVYLSIQNMYEYPQRGETESDESYVARLIAEGDRIGVELYDGMGPEIKARLIELGYDGARWKHSNGEAEYVAFRPDQIKSASSNTGAFQGPNILEQNGDTAQPGPLPEGRTNLERWNAMTLDQQRPYWEHFAEQYEQYAMTGKAPTKALQTAFSAFAKWMKSVYQSFKNFLLQNPQAKPLDPEITQYFDRMLATDAELEAAREERGYKALFKAAVDAGMSPSQFADYMALDELQKTEANELLLSRSLRDMKWLSNAKSKAIKELQAEADELRALVRAGVEEELVDTPIRKAERWLRKGEMVQDGEQIKATAGFKLNAEIVKAMFPQGAVDSVDLAKLKQMMSSTGTQHPDDVAAIFGFRNGETMVRELLELQPFKDEASQLTDLRMLEEHGDLATPEAIEKAADAAISNNGHLKMIATELWALSGRTGSVAPLVKAAKEFAKNLIGNTVVKKLSPVQYTNASTRAGKMTERLLKKGERDAAGKEKRLQVINAAAAKEAYAAEAEVRAMMNRLRKIANYSDKHSSVTSREFSVVQAVRAILGEFEIGSKGEKAQTYVATVSEYDPMLGARLKEVIDTVTAVPKPWQELTVDELRELHAEVGSLWTLARDARTVELAGEKMTLDEARAELTAKINESRKAGRKPGSDYALTKAEIRNQEFMSTIAVGIRPETWFKMQDGLDDYGPWIRRIWNAIARPQEAYTAEKAAKIKELRALLEPIMSDLTTVEIDAWEIGYTFGKGAVPGYAELLHAIIHTGNTSNKERLLLIPRTPDVAAWGSVKQDGTLDSSKWDAFMARMFREGKITKAHMDFVQGIWDLNESMKPSAQKAHRATKGRYFPEIPATEVVTPFGTYRGGYAPAVADPRLSPTAEAQKAIDNMQQDVMSTFEQPLSGFTKERSASAVKGRPLELNIASLGRHIDSVLLFSHMAVPVRNVQRVLRGEGVLSALSEKDRDAMMKVIMPWLNSAVTQRVTETGKHSVQNWRVWSAARSRSGMSTMFGHISNALQQLTGFFPALTLIKPSELLFTAGKGFYQPKKLAASVAEMSPYMAQRLDTEAQALADEVEQIMLNPGKFEKAQDWAGRHAYFLQMAVDFGMSPIIWQAKFNEVMAEGKGRNLDADGVAALRQKAIDLADSAVRMTQGSNRAIDVAAIEKGSPLYRLFLQFAGWFNTQANLLGLKMAQERLLPGGAKRYGRNTMHMALIWWAPAIVSMIIALAMRGGPDDADGDGLLDDWLAELLMAPVKFALATVPVGGAVITAFINAFNDKPYDDRMPVAPVISVIEAGARGAAGAVKAIEDPEKAGRAIRDLGSFFSLMSGVPITPVTKAIGYATDVETGKVAPTSAADYGRGIITGTASPESKR